MMTRTPKFPTLYQPQQKSLGDWVETTPTSSREKNKSVQPKQWQRALERVSHSFESGDWSASTALDLVATYAICHKLVYGVDAGELVGTELHKVRMVAGKFFTVEFEQDIASFVDYTRWFWKREKIREKSRRDGDSANSNRIGWRLFFNRSMLTDWKLAKARNNKQ